MPLESRIAPEEGRALAAAAAAMIDAVLSRRTPEVRDAFWAAVRKCYDAPYNARAAGAAADDPALRCGHRPGTATLA